MESSEKIEGGFILIARKLFNGDIMDKPPLYFKLWLWMIEQARFKPCSGLERGQFKTSIKEMQEAMSHTVGFRRVVPTSKQIRDAYMYFSGANHEGHNEGHNEGPMKGTMIGTMKVTGGLIITINNYSKYQDIKNYEGHNEGHNEGPMKGTMKVERRAHCNKGKKEKECKEGKEGEKTDRPTKPDGMVLPDWIDKKTWDDFHAHRKAIKAPMSAQADTRMINQLEKMMQDGQDPNAVLDQSILNGWKGVFPVKQQQLFGNANEGQVRQIANGKLVQLPGGRTMTSAGYRTALAAQELLREEGYTDE